MRQAGREFPDPRGQSLGTWQPALTRNLDSTAASPVTGSSGMTEVFDVDLGRHDAEKKIKEFSD